jgi:hypothetical protein
MPHKSWVSPSDGGVGIYAVTLCIDMMLPGEDHFALIWSVERDTESSASISSLDSSIV